MIIEQAIRQLRETYKDCSPDQRSLTDQLQDLWEIGIACKMYDAVDFIIKYRKYDGIKRLINKTADSG